MTAVYLRGPAGPTGVYVLHLECRVPLSVAFGRFAGSRPVALTPGEFIYVGSAMGRGATALAGRLLRHATRRSPQPPHDLRSQILTDFASVGLTAAVPQDKTLRWHIDYLLDEPAVRLAAVWALRSAESMEASLANWLGQRPDLAPVAGGLGASDHRGASHLMRIVPPVTWAELRADLDAAWGAY